MPTLSITLTKAELDRKATPTERQQALELERQNSDLTMWEALQAVRLINKRRKMENK